MLLEVIVSMGLLIFGMVMVGLQINAGLDAARASDIGTRAVMLADSKLSELDAGIIRPERIGDEEALEGDFGIVAPGFTWRLTVEPSASLIEDFYFVKLEIGYDESQVREQIEDPTYKIEFDDPHRRTVRTVYRLWPKPAGASPERDFGISPEQMDKFMEAMAGAMTAGGLGETEGTGSSGLDLERVAEMFSELMQTYAQTGTFDFAALSQLPEEEFMLIAEMLEVLYGRGGAGALAKLKELFPQLAQQAGQGQGQQGSGQQGQGQGPPQGNSSAGDGSGTGAGDNSVNRPGRDRNRDRRRQERD